MKMHAIKKNIKRTVGVKSFGSGATNGFFGDDDLLRKKTKVKFERSLSTLLPYSHYDEEQDLYFNEIEEVKESKVIKLKVNCGFIIEADPLSGCTEEKIDILANLFTDGLPEGLIVQVINYASPRVGDLLDLWKNARKKEGGIYEELAQKRVDHLLSARWKSLFPRPFVIRDFKVYIAVWLDIDRYSDVPNRLKDLREIFHSNLQNVGLNSSNLYPEDFLTFLDEILNPQKDKTHKEGVRWDRLNNLNTQAIDNESYFDIKKNHIELRDDLAVSSFSVRSFPEFWGAWEMRNLLGSENNDFLRLSCPFAQIFTFYVLSAEKTNAKTIIKSTRSESQANSPMRSFIPGIADKARDWKFVLGHIKKGKRLLEGQYRVLLFADQKKLAKEEETLKGLFKTLGWNISKDTFSQLPCFLSSLPFWLNEDRWKEMKLMGKTKTLLSWNAANIAPIIADYKGTPASPYMMFVSRRGQPIYWNPFFAGAAGGNFNVIIVGKPGSGKSVAMQDIVASARGTSGRAFVIDNGRSFKNSSQFQDGKFIEINDDICINPFTMFEWDAIKNDSDYRDSIQNFFTSLISQICRPITPINEDEKALIGLAIWEVLIKYDKKGSLELVATELMQVAKTAQQKQIAESLCLSLDMFIKKYGRFFTGHSDIQMDGQLIVFELANISGKGMEDLKSVVMITLMHLIRETIYKGDRKTQSTLEIDEFWALANGEAFGDFTEDYVRTIRKYGGNLVTGTQLISDYDNNPASRAVLGSSQWKIFFAQNKDSINYMKKNKIITVDRALEEALKSLKMVSGCYSEVLVYGDTGWFIGRLILDPFSVFLYSSKAQDVAKLEDLRKQGLSIGDAVNKMIEESK